MMILLLIFTKRYTVLCVGFHSIWVSSDHPEILATAVKNDGVQVHQRSAATSTDDASSVDAIQEFLACHPGLLAGCINESLLSCSPS